MRFILFYESTESFNYFTDEIANELIRRGHEVFILDLLHPTAPSHSTSELMNFCSQKPDAVICFDRAGIHDDTYNALWDMMDTCVVHILMDHPLRFHPTMENHPGKYIQFCPDEEHVRYVQKYFPDLEHVYFLAHAGTIDTLPPIPYEDKKYDILFSGTYYVPESKLHEIEYMCPKDSPLYHIYLEIGQYLISHTDYSLDHAVHDVLEAHHMPLSVSSCRTIMRGMTPIDWMVRMYYRGEVIRTLIDAGLQVHVLGRGWENHPSVGADNFHILSNRIDLSDTFNYMRDARINLNVMPWFKEGTHDRIFNTMLHHSICLTDSSTWIDSHYENGRDIVLYDLKQLEKLPETARYWLSHPDHACELITNGYEKTLQNYTWINCVNDILGALDRCYDIH